MYFFTYFLLQKAIYHLLSFYLLVEFLELQVLFYYHITFQLEFLVFGTL